MNRCHKGDRWENELVSRGRWIGEWIDIKKAMNGRINQLGNVSMSRGGMNICQEGELTNMNWKVIIGYKLKVIVYGKMVKYIKSLLNN